MSKKIFTIALFVVSIFCYYAAGVSPLSNWWLAFLGYINPILFLLNFVLLIFWSVKMSKQCIFPFLVLLLTFPVFRATYAVGELKPPAKGELSVFSYNVRYFNRKSHVYFDKDYKSEPYYSTKFIDWVSKVDADVKCFQEFYTDDDSRYYNTIKAIDPDSSYYRFRALDTLMVNDSRFGLMMFSKYPIINSGMIDFSQNAMNKAQYADILIHDDTVRVINLHMESTQLGLDKGKGYRKLASLNTWRKMKYTTMSRARQVEEILAIAEGREKVIITGDFNETPYGFVYRELADELNNSFEEAGHGFGFTFNLRGYKFLRIDHQFHSDNIEALSFGAMNNIPYSDHYPIIGKYKVK
ncbi:endonuclease/exonuclease/phosphatase family protein [Fulvivirga ligni]|uniref:endonuclease/exonuclease/phosphatase family protein n=1 Tax=Fulvivirga ligni TaxID=2904246 RepID=UPI001F3F459E|nr:endonuclease/exonuclease/phosphatase family protein [Fulvivirga ligni]UII19720.1 endonuclease/exonuclease/phosphatase family protein [Fulvivirga ligni]